MSSTIKQISEHPASNAVTSPTDPKLKALDIDRKLSLYAVVESLRNGKYPSNRQIEETLDYALNNSPIDHKKLSKDGRMLVQDAKNIIQTAKQIVKEKNEDELFQNFLYHTRQVDTSKGDLTNKVNVGIKNDDVNQDGAQAVENLRILGKLIFTNSEARKLLKDISLLGRDVLADGAAHLSETARPDQEALARADEPAPSNQWVGPDGETRDHNQSVPSTGLQETADKLQGHKEDLQSSFQDSANNVQGAAQSGAGVSNQGEAKEMDQDQAREGASRGIDKAKEEKDRLVNKLSSKIPQEHKDNAREQYGKAKDYAKDKFPEERRQRFIYRLKKVIVECQRHRDYQEAIEFFLDRAENYSAVARDATGQAASGAVDVRQDGSFQQAEFELRTLLERFANGNSTQPIFDAVNQIYTDSKDDPELRAWFKELAAYVRACLQEPGYIMKEASDKKGQQLQDQGQRFFDPSKGKYAGHKDALFNSISTFFSGWNSDRLNQQLGKDVKKLTKDLLMDAEGNLKYKPHLWNDIREQILPTLIKNFGGYIPIPRIEYSDNMVDVVIENLTVETANLLPNILEFEAKNYFKISPYSAIKDQSKHSFWISFSQVQADLKDVAFYIKKKSGFPKLQDSGVADVTISGSGISGKIQIESTGKKHDLFKVIDVKVKIDKLKFAVRGSKHSLLIATFKPLATGLIKKAIAKAMQEGIRTALIQLDSQLADISERLEKVSEDDDISTLEGYKSVYNDKKNQAQATKEDVTPPGQFQISAKRDSRIVQWSSENSMVEKQAEKEKLALEGKEWRSPAFDIVKGANNPSTGNGSTQHLTGNSADGQLIGNGNSASGVGAATGTGTGTGNGHSTAAPQGQSDLSKFVGTHTTNNAQNEVDHPNSTPATTSTPIAHQYQQQSQSPNSNIDNQFNATGNTSMPRLGASV